MSERPASPEELKELGARIDGWLTIQAAENPVVLSVERDGSEYRWFMRVKGEEKDVYTIRYHLRQRTLHYETHFMPAPEENELELYSHLLRRNLKMYGGGFVIGDEDAIIIQGQLDRAMITEDELDRVIGSIYAWVEQYFKPALRIGFASRFA